MRNVRKNINKLEDAFKEVEQGYLAVDKEVQELEVDEDGVIIIGSLEFEISELGSTISTLADGLSETLGMLENLLDEFDDWSV